MIRVTFEFAEGWGIHVDACTEDEDNAVNIAKAKLYSLVPQLRPLVRSLDLPEPQVERLGPKAA